MHYLLWKLLWHHRIDHPSQVAAHPHGHLLLPLHVVSVGQIIMALALAVYASPVYLSYKHSHLPEVHHLQHPQEHHHH